MRAGRLAALLLVIAGLVGCRPEPAADQTHQEIEAAEPGDPLAALGSRRSANPDGEELEARAMAARSESATAVYASTEDEPGLSEAAEQSGSSGNGLPVNRAGSSMPSDLDRAATTLDPWINMDLVSQAIQGQKRGIKSCWLEASSRRSLPGDRLDVAITIDTFGRPSSLRLEPTSPIQDRGLFRCVQSVLAKAPFPEAQHASVRFVYPLRF